MWVWVIIFEKIILKLTIRAGSGGIFGGIMVGSDMSICSLDYTGFIAIMTLVFDMMWGSYI